MSSSISTRNRSYSIVIPAFNESKALGATIEAVLAAIGRAASLGNATSDLVIVDNASTDDTADVAAQYGVRVIHEERPGAGAARNAGAEATNGQYLVFIDADVIVSPLFLVAIDAAIETHSLLAGAPTAIYHPRKLVSWFICAYWDRRRVQGGGAQGVGQFYERRLFESLGGYRADMRMSEDVEFYGRATDRLTQEGLRRPELVLDSIVWPSARRYDEWSNIRMLAFQNAWIVRLFSTNPRFWRAWREGAVR